MYRVESSIEQSSVWSGEIEDASASLKRARQDGGDVASLAKRARVEEAATQQPALSSEGNGGLLSATHYSALPQDVFDVITSEGSLRDCLALALVDKASWLMLKGKVDLMVTLIQKDGPTMRAREIANALTMIGLQPVMWRAAQLRYLARKTEACEFRDDVALSAQWACRLNNTKELVVGAEKGHGYPIDETQITSIRDLKIAGLYPNTGGIRLERYALDGYPSKIPSCLANGPLRSLAEIFRVHGERFVDVNLDFAQLVAPYGRNIDAIPLSIINRIMLPRNLHGYRKRLKEALLCRSDLSKDFERRPLDQVMIKLIVACRPYTYTALVTDCERWRRGDAAFRTAVEKAVVRSTAAVLLLDRWDDSACYVGPTDSGVMRLHMRAFVLESERETVVALKCDAANIKTFLDLCERFSVNKDRESARSLLHIASAAPWPMQPVLLHRLTQLLYRDREALLEEDDDEDGAKIAQRGEALKALDVIITELQAFALTVFVRCSNAGDLALLGRMLATYLDCLGLWVNEGKSFWRVNLLLRKAADELPPKYWVRFITTFAHLENQHGSDINSSISFYINRFLCDPEVHLSNVDESVFEAFKFQIPKLWNVLPDASDDATQRLSALAIRFGFSDDQREALRKWLLRSLVSHIEKSEMKIDQGLAHFGLTSAADRRYVEQRVWKELLLRPLSASPRLSMWMTDVIANSDYLKQKVEIFLEPIDAEG